MTVEQLKKMGFRERVTPQGWHRLERWWATATGGYFFLDISASGVEQIDADLLRAIIKEGTVRGHTLEG